MRKIKILLFSIIFILSGCGIIDVETPNVGYNNTNNYIKKEFYDSFFSDLSNVISNKNVSIIMRYDKETDTDNDFYMQLDSITENDSFKDIYFSLFLAENNGVEIYHMDGSTLIGFKNNGYISWYTSDMTMDSIIDLENNTTSITHIFEGYMIQEIVWLEEITIGKEVFDKVSLKVVKATDNNICSEYICYINTKTNSIEQIDVKQTDNIDTNYSIFIKPIESIKEKPNIDISNLKKLDSYEFDNKFMELLLNSIGNNLDITDISEL